MTDNLFASSDHLCKCSKMLQNVSELHGKTQIPSENIENVNEIGNIRTISNFNDGSACKVTVTQVS